MLKKITIMKINIERYYFGADYTIGRLSINGQQICNTMEPHRIDWETEQKIPGKTAIPEGTYSIQILLSPKFKRLMPYLKNVPHFRGILLHCGTTVKDSRGCILVGYNTQRGMLLKSREAFRKIMEKIEYARKSNQEITLTIK